MEATGMDTSFSKIVIYFRDIVT